jgi:hypothetical protein
MLAIGKASTISRPSAIKPSKIVSPRQRGKNHAAVHVNEIHHDAQDGALPIRHRPH